VIARRTSRSASEVGTRTSASGSRPFHATITGSSGRRASSSFRARRASVASRTDVTGTPIAWSTATVLSTPARTRLPKTFE
jgi:hypothetical protein